MAAIRKYQRLRDQTFPVPKTTALFVARRGHPDREIDGGPDVPGDPHPGGTGWQCYDGGRLTGDSKSSAQMIMVDAEAT